MKSIMSLLLIQVLDNTKVHLTFIVINGDGKVLFIEIRLYLYFNLDANMNTVK